MTYATFDTPREDRYYEDYEIATYELGSFRLSEQEIIEFARRFDPQRFHTDPAAAASSPYGGLIASGWHTGSAVMRLLADRFISAVAGLGSPGLDELSWHRPVRPDTEMTVRVTVLSKRRSRSKPDRGILSHKIEAFDPRGELAMTVRGKMFLLLRKPEAPDAEFEPRSAQD